MKAEYSGVTCHFCYTVPEKSCLPVILNEKLIILSFVDFPIKSNVVGIGINGAGPGIQFVFLLISIGRLSKLQMI